MDKKGIDNNAFKGDTIITAASFGGKCTTIGESAFENCTSLKKINDDNVVEEIGSNAFARTKLTTAKFNNLTELNSYAFLECSYLKNISIPKCTTIPMGAFKGCKSLKEIDFSNITYIDVDAFKGCENITQISLPVCEHIGSNAFVDCHNLTKVYIYKGGSDTTNSDSDSESNSDSICTLGNKNVFNTNYNIIFYFNKDVFSNYYGDENWEVYKDKMSIMPQPNLIIYKTNDKDILGFESESDSDPNIVEEVYIEEICGYIEFENDIDEISDEMFKEQKTLTYISIPSNCKTIGKYAFSDCEKLASFTIPQSVTEIGEGAFKGCDNIKKFEGKFATDDGKAVVCGITLICALPKDEPFEGSGELYNYSISEINSNITRLGEYCFYGCENMRRIDIPSNIISIGDSAFEGCKNLCEVHFYGHTPPKLGNNAFVSGTVREDFKIFVPEESIAKYHKKWKEENNSEYEKYKEYIYPMPKDNCVICYTIGLIITIANGCEYTITYKKHADDFINNGYYIISNLDNIFPSSLLVNDNNNNNRFKKVIIGENIHTIESGAFYGCTRLDYIHLPDSLYELGEKCFYGCSSLKNIYLPELITNIGISCFENSGITELNLSFYTMFRDIPSSAFKNCTELTSVNISNTSIEIIGSSAFYGCTKLSNVNLSLFLWRISDYAFYNCTSLEKITLSPRLEELGNFSLDINNTDTYFSVCIPIELSEPPEMIRTNILQTLLPFGMLNGIKLIIHVPDSLMDTYINDPQWEKYKQFMESY